MRAVAVMRVQGKNRRQEAALANRRNPRNLLQGLHADGCIVALAILVGAFTPTATPAQQEPGGLRSPVLSVTSYPGDSELGPRHSQTIMWSAPEAKLRKPRAVLDVGAVRRSRSTQFTLAGAVIGGVLGYTLRPDVNEYIYPVTVGIWVLGGAGVGAITGSLIERALPD